MENVNKQLLDAAKSLVSALNEAMPHMQTDHEGVGPDCTKQFQALIDGAQAIAAAERAQQAEPVAAQCRFEGEEWKYCTIAHHLLVQAHPKEWPHYETRALYTQPPAVAVPDGYALVPIDPTSKMLMAADRVIWADADILGNYCNLWNAMLAASQKGNQ